jgi:hypothetical protein
MGEAFRLGGWGMYPTTIVGLVVMFTALMYARDPDRRRYAVVKTLSILVLLTSVLGFIVGTMRSFLGTADVPSAEAPHYALVGVGESLHNVALGLCILVVTWIMVAVGAARTAAPASREDLTDPHRP